jgi:hypothetical protein
MSTIFDIGKRTIRRALFRGAEDPNPPGRHIALDTETESVLIAMLPDAFRRD